MRRAIFSLLVCLIIEAATPTPFSWYGYLAVGAGAVILEGVYDEWKAYILGYNSVEDMINDLEGRYVPEDEEDMVDPDDTNKRSRQ